jgi:hypothetical protein
MSAPILLKGVFSYTFVDDSCLQFMPKDTTMRINPVARLALAVTLLATLSVAGLAAQAATPLPTRKPLLQVNLKANETYYLETFKADIERRESGLNPLSAQKGKTSSKDKLAILLDTIDLMLFRQLCDREGIKVSDSDVAGQIAQYKASMGPGATDAMVEANMRRSGVYLDMKAYVKQDLLFATYLKAKNADDIKAISQPGAADLLKTYDDMKFNLRRPSSYRFTMLLAATQGKGDAEKKKAADTMRAIADKLKANPSGFDEYFVKGMVDAQAAGYQTMPYVIIAKTSESKSQYPSLYDAIFKLKEGEVSDLIEENLGYCIVRVSQYLPEKQLGLDDFIEGLNSKAASGNPSATVMALVVNEFQTTKYAELQQKTRAAINARLRKEGNVTIVVSNLTDQLDAPEIAALKALANKGSGYSVAIQ